MRKSIFAALCLVTLPAFVQPAEAQWSVTPSAGLALRGRTGYFDPDDAARRRKFVFGLAVARTWRRFGVEAEVARVGGFLTGRGDAALITSSSIHTATANLIVKLPRAGPFQPYAVAGLGAGRVSAQDVADLVPVSECQLLFDVGAGVQVPASRRISFGADARYFRSRRGAGSSSSIGFGDTFVDFVRLSATMTFAIGGS